MCYQVITHWLSLFYAPIPAGRGILSQRGGKFEEPLSYLSYTYKEEANPCSVVTRGSSQFVWNSVSIAIGCEIENNLRIWRQSVKVANAC